MTVYVRALGMRDIGVRIWIVLELELKSDFRKLHRMNTTILYAARSCMRLSIAIRA
jgi:hypothetical protein